MRIVGLDPASYVTGAAIIDDGALVHSGAIGVSKPQRERAAVNTWTRVQKLAARVYNFVCQWAPDIVAVEVTRPVSYRDLPQLKGRTRLREDGPHRGIDNVIVYKQACAAAAAAAGLAAMVLPRPRRIVVLHLDVDDWKKRKGKAETLFEARSLYKRPLDGAKHETDIADAIMIAHTAWGAWSMAHRTRMDFMAYCLRTFKRSQVWDPSMLVKGRDE